MSQPIIGKVLRDGYSDVEGIIYSGQLLSHLYSHHCIGKEEMAQVNALPTVFDKGRKLLHILSTK